MLAAILEHRYGSPRNFILNVRLWLQDHEITQQALADEVGLDLTNINRWLNHRITPSLRNMVILDEAIERIINRRKS